MRDSRNEARKRFQAIAYLLRYIFEMRWSAPSHTPFGSTGKCPLSLIPCSGTRPRAVRGHLEDARDVKMCEAAKLERSTCKMNEIGHLPEPEDIKHNQQCHRDEHVVNQGLAFVLLVSAPPTTPGYRWRSDRVGRVVPRQPPGPLLRRAPDKR